MNLDTMDELRAYLDRLEELPFIDDVAVITTESSAGDRGIDALLEVRTPSGVAVFEVELKRTHLSHAVAERLLHVRPRGGRERLLLCPYVGRELAERFGRERLNFVDLAGNCHLQISDRYLVHIEGRRGEVKPASDRALRAQSYRVLFAMLVEPELTMATARRLAEAAGGVSPQTALDLRQRFVARGILLQTSRGLRWAPRGWRDAFDLFVAGFATTLAPQLAIGRYRARERDLRSLEAELAHRLEAIGDVSWRWGGGAACERLSGHFRGDRTVVYVDAAHHALASSLRLVPDKDGPVWLAVKPGPLAFQAPVAECVHPLLAYVDLLSENDERAREGAAELFRRYLASIERTSP